jgi:hypothetical protein
MERKALLNGHRLSASAFGQIANDERAGRLDKETLEAIADATGETVEAIAALDDARWGIFHDVATGSGGPRVLSDLSLEQLADEQRRIADEMMRRARDGA